MKKLAFAILVSTTLGLTACQPPPPVDPMQVKVTPLETEQQKQAYAMGASIGGYLEAKLASQKEMGIEHDPSLIVKGFIAGLQKQSQIPQEEIVALNKAIEAESKNRKLELDKISSEKNKAKGADFLANNAKRKGIIVTESGLQYEILKQGEGNKPVATDTVKVHYLGTLLDGTEFDSSYSRNAPATFPLNRVIKGWTEGLQHMAVGSKFKFYIPSNLAYGGRKTGKITSHSTLIFEVELLDIIETEKPAEK